MGVYPDGRLGTSGPIASDPSGPAGSFTQRVLDKFSSFFLKKIEFCFGPLPDQCGSFGTKPSATDVKNPKEAENRARNPPKPPKNAKKRQKPKK